MNAIIEALPSFDVPAEPMTSFAPSSVWRLLGLGSGTKEEHEMLGACSICLETLSPGQTARRLPCMHVFHTDCIDRWLRRGRPTCPLDNSDVRGAQDAHGVSGSLDA